MPIPSTFPLDRIRFVDPLRETGREIRYVDAAPLYCELSRRSLQDVILPGDPSTVEWPQIFADLIERNRPIEVGTIEYFVQNRPGYSRLQFADGRHRTAALVHLGMKKVPLSCDPAASGAIAIIEAEWKWDALPANARWIFKWCPEAKLLRTLRRQFTQPSAQWRSRRVASITHPE